jgi:hypothetical protein
LDVIPIAILVCINAVELGFLAGNLSKVVWATSQNRNWIIIQASVSVMPARPECAAPT